MYKLKLVSYIYIENIILLDKSMPGNNSLLDEFVIIFENLVEVESKDVLSMLNL